MLLDVQNLSTGYGDLPVVRDTSLTVDEGQIVTVVGANGAGKSTMLRAITGLLPCWNGHVVFDGNDITAAAAHRIPEHGLIMVPEGRRLFGFMTVMENLQLGANSAQAKRAAAQSLERAFELFPILYERRAQLAGSMSGGEQQMCAIARALMAQPRLLILDEPSIGLAPIIVEQLLALIRRLASEGLTILLVEQNVNDALEMADHGYVLDQGSFVMEGTGAELLARPDLQQAYLGL